MDEETFIHHPKAVPAFQDRVALWCADRGPKG
jgi:hypothetical protein